MDNFLNIIILIIIVGISVHTTSYGIWTWQNENKSGGFMIFIVALTVLLFPLYLMFFRFG